MTKMAYPTKIREFINLFSLEKWGQPPQATDFPLLPLSELLLRLVSSFNLTRCRFIFQLGTLTKST